MTKEEIRELIQDLIQEYMGTGDMASTGLTSDDGNNITSQRPFYDEDKELEYYTDHGAPYGGAEGNHYNKDTVGIKPPPNRTQFTKF